MAVVATYLCGCILTWKQGDISKEPWLISLFSLSYTLSPLVLVTFPVFSLVPTPKVPSASSQKSLALAEHLLVEQGQVWLCGQLSSLSWALGTECEQVDGGEGSRQLDTSLESGSCVLWGQKLKRHPAASLLAFLPAYTRSGFCRKGPESLVSR
jgi:hypothetical protein